MTNVLLTGSLESFIQLLGALFIFAVVLAATYLTTRWMGGMQRGRQNNKNPAFSHSVPAQKRNLLIDPS